MWALWPSRFHGNPVALINPAARESPILLKDLFKP